VSGVDRFSVLENAVLAAKMMLIRSRVIGTAEILETA